MAESLMLTSGGVSRLNTIGELVLVWIPVTGFAVQGEVGNPCPILRRVLKLNVFVVSCSCILGEETGKL